MISTEKKEELYQRWVNGETFTSLSETVGTTKEGVRQMCITLAHKKNLDSWKWLYQFGSVAIALFIRNGIHNEAELHEWWGNGQELKGINLKRVNAHLSEPLVYVKPKRVNTNLIDLTGQRFGRLTVIKKAESKGNVTRWECLCDCGKTTVVQSRYLRGGNTKSCGCLANEYRHSVANNGIHGLAKVVKCHTCVHFNELTCKCREWNAATVPNGYCHKGEKG